MIGLKECTQQPRNFKGEGYKRDNDIPKGLLINAIDPDYNSRLDGKVSIPLYGHKILVFTLFRTSK